MTRKVENWMMHFLFAWRVITVSKEEEEVVEEKKLKETYILLTHINHASLELRRSSLVKASVSELLWPEGWARLALMAFR